ncbi:hypothetical protein [uncultured Rikenella sp.]|uniref:hypothetical protein n=1 Tax=uncultured Rikenella sp. TaxID=368003 RepID=UPI0025E5979B|nr:hypothetical protein [uncultured Rikenella sp.]
MCYYFVVNTNGTGFCLEDLSTHKQFSVTKTTYNQFQDQNGKTATIQKILPPNFNLTIYRCEKDLLITSTGTNDLLYRLSDHLQQFTPQHTLEQDSIIELSAWK